MIFILLQEVFYTGSLPCTPVKIDIEGYINSHLSKNWHECWERYYTQFVKSPEQSEAGKKSYSRSNVSKIGFLSFPAKR